MKNLACFVLSAAISFPVVAGTANYSKEAVGKYVYTKVSKIGEHFKPCSSLAKNAAGAFVSDNVYVSYSQVTTDGKAAQINILLGTTQEPVLISGTFIVEDDVCQAAYTINVTSSDNCAKIGEGLSKGFNQVFHDQELKTRGYANNISHNRIYITDTGSHCNASFTLNVTHKP
jgi:hypothetical protein